LCLEIALTTALKNELENRENREEKAHKKDLVEYIGKM
jgi:hypothetical protein